MCQQNFPQEIKKLWDLGCCSIGVYGFLVVLWYGMLKELEDYVLRKLSRGIGIFDIAFLRGE